MGGDISVFEDDQLEKDLDILCKDESLMDLFNRSLSGMTNVLTQPKRFIYDSSFLECRSETYKEYNCVEFELLKEDLSLHCAKWTRNVDSEIYILYVHTNTRSLVDALEVLPLCDLLDAHLVAFDLQGCGKSSGDFSLSNALDLRIVVDSILSTHPLASIVLWARGIGTNTAIDYLNTSLVSPNIKFVVLDSPFTTLFDVVFAAASQIESLSQAVPTIFIKFALSLIRNSVRKQIGIDPYEIRPIRSACHIRTPCFILSADNDEYIPESMGVAMQNMWAGQCWLRSFPGRHYGDRDICLIMTPFEKILPFVGRDSDRNIRIDTIDHSEGATGESEHKQQTDDSNLTSQKRDTSMTPETVRRAAPVWVSDSATNLCTLCQSSFNLLNRKHHCRSCGALVCKTCSRNRLALANQISGQSQDPVRVCDVCYLSLNPTSFNFSAKGQL